MIEVHISDIHRFCICLHHCIIMLDFVFSSGLFGLILPCLVVVAQAAIGPITDLHITNRFMAPDGFNRSVAVAGGALPGPLIKGNKVSLYIRRSASVSHLL